MSSETITRNDLTNILNEIGTGVSYEDTGAIQLVTGIKYRRKNGIVFVDCYVGAGTTMTTSYQTLGTLPEGYRPLETQYAPMGINNANIGVAYVSDTGAIGAKTFSGTTTYYWFHFAYPVAQNALFDEKVDHVVEQGTIGNWTYRKWNSGILEQWYTGNPGNYTIGTTRGNLYSGGILLIRFLLHLLGIHLLLVVQHYRLTLMLYGHKKKDILRHRLL